MLRFFNKVLIGRRLWRRQKVYLGNSLAPNQEDLLV